MSVGGPAKHVINLTKGLNKEGFETELISGQPNENEDNLFELASVNNIPVKILKSMNRAISPLKDLFSLISIIKEIKRFDPDIVHTHTSKAGILGRLAAYICKVPAIYHTYHGHIFTGYVSKLASSIIIAIERIFAVFSTNLISLSPKLTNEIKLILRPRQPEKLVTIPLGLELKSNLQTPRRKKIWRTKAGFTDQDFIVGIIARLVPIKNHSLIINSMSKLCRTFPNLHLVIIGDGELKDELKSLSEKLNLTKNLHFFGIIKNLEDIYSDLDLLILCSKNEGTPVAIIESLASGCPVASTDVGGVSEVLENWKLGRKLSTEPEIFTQNLSKAISDLISNKYEEYPTDETRKRICDYYSVEKLVNNIKKLYLSHS